MAKPQIYTMKWNNYQNHISGIFLQLLETESMVDLTLCAEGEKISCHRIILSACSPYFQEILSGINSKNAVVILCGIPAEDVRSIIEFVYKGELNVSSERFVSILRAAESLKISGLMEVKNHLTVLDTVTLKDGEPSKSVEGDDNCDVTRVKRELLAQEELICPENLVETAEQTEENEDESGASFTIITDENEDLSDYSLQIATPIHLSKKKRKREFSRRDYSEDALSAALEDLAQGHNLLETANIHHIPRSTLYARAKSYGITPTITRHEYSEEKLAAAVDMVKTGASLQSASIMYGIPKTVLWRRVQRDIGSYALSRRARMRQRYLPHAKEAAVRALENGEKINKVASMYKIPKTTLFREKSRLVQEGKLPMSCLNKREPNKDSYKQLRLRQAVAACKEGMSQAAASSTFKVSKTTIWRRLQQSRERKQIQFIKAKEEPIEEEGDTSVQFEEIVSKIPVTYSEDNPYTEASFIILAPNSEIPIGYETAEQVVVESVLVAESVGDVGEVIEIPTYVEDLPASQTEECSTSQDNMM